MNTAFSALLLIPALALCAWLPLGLILPVLGPILFPSAHGSIFLVYISPHFPRRCTTAYYPDQSQYQGALTCVGWRVRQMRHFDEMSWHPRLPKVCLDAPSAEDDMLTGVVDFFTSCEGDGHVKLAFHFIYLSIFRFEWLPCAICCLHYALFESLHEKRKGHKSNTV